MRNTDLWICTWMRKKHLYNSCILKERHTRYRTICTIADWEVMWSGMFQRVLGCFDNLRRTLCSPTTVPVFLFTIFDFDPEKTHLDQHVGMWRSETQKLWWHHINRSYKPWDWNLRCCLVSDSQLSTRHCAWTQLFFGEKKHYHPRARGRQTKLASRLTETDTSLCSWWRPKIEQKGEWLLDVQLSDGQKHISKWEIILLCMCWMSEYVNVVCLQHVSIAP